MIRNQYPIGKYEPQDFSEDLKRQWIADIRSMPALMEYAVQHLSEEQLHTPYRAGGWTIHELVHHVADSHMNAFIRFKLCLTEDNPVIKPYDENLWVKTEDCKALPVNNSITLLFALHRKWVALLESVTADQWERTVYHPEHKKEMTLWYLLGMYAWHSRHHVAQIEQADGVLKTQ